MEDKHDVIRIAGANNLDDNFPLSFPFPSCKPSVERNEIRNMVDDVYVECNEKMVSIFNDIKENINGIKTTFSCMQENLNVIETILSDYDNETIETAVVE